MQFEILGEISDIETFATGSGIREINRLRKSYGRGRRRKRKGIARVRLTDGAISMAEIHWYEAAVLDTRNSRSSTCFERKNMARTPVEQFFVCIDNDGYTASLEKRKIYVGWLDADAEKHGLLRIVDESGDDYLYPKTLFRQAASGT
jgi:hypothetical protein